MMSAGDDYAQRDRQLALALDGLPTTPEWGA